MSTQYIVNIELFELLQKKYNNGIVRSDKLFRIVRFVILELTTVCIRHKYSDGKGVDSFI